MSDVNVYSTVAWSAGPGCHGGCGQKHYVKDGQLIKIEYVKNEDLNLFFVKNV